MADSARFSDRLLESTRETWDAAVTHPFVKELFAGTVPDEDMAGYLIQDYRFADGFMALLGAAVATADDLAPRLRFAEFLGEIAGDENTYFVDSLEELSAHGSGAAERDAIPDTEPTRGFKKIFAEAAETRDYAVIVSVVLVCEWLYLDWATREENTALAPGGMPERHVHAEWVRLHDYPGFHELVDFLRGEIDRVGERTPETAAQVEEFFTRTVDLELEFFDESLSN